MDPMLVFIACIIGLFVLMMLGVPIAFSLGFVGIIGGLVAFGSNILSKVGWAPFSLLFNLSWTPLPLFVLIGSLIAETTMGKDLFNAAAKWLSRIPGGLIASGIIGEGVMAATLGTSAACIMVVGKVAVPEFERYGYNRSLGLGALLAGGVLGPLIPPSATMIIYSCLTNTSLGHLFMAGIMPGILLAVMLASMAIGICAVRPQLGPPAGSFTWKERFASLSRVWPIVLVILSILGTIYMGVATPTESAGVGCVVVFLLGIFLFKLRWEGIRRALIDAATINAMILLILIGASFFTYIVGSTNVAQHAFNFVQSSGISKWMVIIVINVIYLALGFILDPLTITFLTIPIFYPLIVNLGFDPVWFGIIFVVNTQIGLITPPMAIDLFAVRTVFNIPTGDLIRGVTPFLLWEIVFLAIIIAFPQISLWLPSLMIAK
jgi:C4-dicarboxylate transporter, DctM subunit